MKATTSASCSRPPDSRRSASIGRLSWRYSTCRLSCESATTGQSSSRARIFRPREISDTSTWRFSTRRVRARRHELDVVDDDEREVAVAGPHAPRLGAHLHDRAVRVVVDEQLRLARDGRPRGSSRDQSPSRELRGPERVASTRASIASSRLVSSSVPISIEKKTTGRPVWRGDVARHAEREARLAHAGTRREDHEVRRAGARRGCCRPR